MTYKSGMRAGMDSFNGKRHTLSAQARG
jgi:hypothetical protein